MKKYYLVILLVCTLLSAKAQINSGSPAKPFNSNSTYSYGIMPGNLPTGGTYGKSTDAANAYNAWKTNFVEACSGKGYRVKFDTPSQTVSEGIAYGMLLSAYAGDKALFDGLWQYYNAYKNGNGVMDWKIDGCNGRIEYNGATDAELDAAMALIVAADQWPTGNYKSQAQNLISIIRQKEIHPSSYQVLNGDAWGTGNNCRNPSYMAPAYFREFAKIESNQSSFWNSVTDVANSFLLSNRNSSTGLVSNWADANSKQDNNCGNTGSGYGFDACRNPWRMANDVLWNGASVATTGSDICTKMSSWLKNNESNLKGPLAANASNPAQGLYKNGTFSTYALAVMGTGSTNQNSLNSCYTNVVNLGSNEAYFSATLRTITLFMLTGNWWKPGSNIVSASISITAPTNNTTVNAGASVTITASATISSGSISKVEFYDGATLLKTVTGTPYTFSTTTLAGGTHVITAKAYDASNTVVATSAPVNITVVSASDVSTTGVTDMFETTTEYGELTGGKDCSTPAKSTSAGIYWWEDVNPSTPFAATKTRTGNGKLTYTITQAQNAYEAIGFSFGDYCNSGTKTPYTIDLRNNAVLKMNVSAPTTNTTNLELKIQLKDVNGKLLVFNSLVVNGSQIRNDWATGAYYRYEIGFNKNHTSQSGQTPAHTDAQVGPGSLVPGTSVNFEFDFKNAVTVSGSNYPTDINLNNTAFDYSKVVSVVIIVVSSTDTGTPNFWPKAFTDQQISFSGMTLGSASTGTDICSAIAPTAATAPSYCQNASATALTATALTGANLQWYGTNQTGGTASTTATIPSTGSTGTATYYVSQKAGACESARTGIPVTVTASVAPTATIAASTGANPIQEGTSVTFTSNVTNGGTGATYQWKKNGANISGATSASYTTTDLKLNDKISLDVTSKATCASPGSVTSNVITVNVVMGIEDVYFKGLEIYPNPVADQLTIDGLKTGFQYQILDVTGKVIMEGTSNGTIDMNQVNSGMFVLMIKSEGKQKLVKLLKN